MKKYNDYTVLFLALGAAFVLVYFVPVTLNRFLFFIFIYLFYKSDRDYIWLAFIFILIESPGGLFGGGERLDDLRLPLYTFASEFSISFEQIFILTALVKAVKKNIKFKPVSFLNKNILILFVYFVFLVLLGIVSGLDIATTVNIYFMFVDLTLFYSVYCLFTKESDYVKFFKMLIPFGFIAFGLQLYSISAGSPLITALKPLATDYSGVYDIEENIRAYEMDHIVLLLFFFSLYLFICKNKYFNRSLLLILNITSFFSIIMTAERGYAVTVTMFYLLSFMFISVRFLNLIIRYGVVIVTAVVIILSFDLFEQQLERSLTRFTTLESFASGDVTAGGTAVRFDVRVPRVMKAFNEESTIIFGAGFSKTYNVKRDGHIGYHNLLYNTGVFGVILFAVFFGSIIMNTLRINKEIKINNPYKNILKIFPITIISLMFINVSSQFYGYDVGTSRILLLIFIIYFLNNQLSCALKWEKENSC